MQSNARSRRHARGAPALHWIEQLERRTLLATVFWDGGGDGTRWHDPLNWSFDAVPSAEDDVSIIRSGTYTVEVSGAPAAAGTLRLGGVSGKQTLLLNAGLSLTAAESSVRVNGILRVASSLAGEASVILSNGSGRVELEGGVVSLRVSNSGTFVAHGASSFTAAGSLDNNAPGRLVIEADDAFGDATLTLPGELINEGALELRSTAPGPRDATLRVGGPLRNIPTGVIRVPAAEGGVPPGGRRVIAAALVNEGMLQVDHDTQLERLSADHSNSGDVQVGLGSLMVLQSGDTPSFTNTGTIAVLPGRSVTIDGGSFVHRGGSISGPAAGAGGTLALRGAAASFEADFSTAGVSLSAEDGAVIGGAGTLTNAPGRTIDLAAATVAAPLVNEGVLRARGACAVTGPFSTSATSTLLVEAGDASGSSVVTFADAFTNLGSIVLTNTAAAPLDATLSVGNGMLVNGAGGTIEAAAGSGGGTRVIAAALDNRGTVTANAALRLAKPGASHTTSGIVRALGGNFTVSLEGQGASFSVTGGTVEVGAGRDLNVSGAGNTIRLQSGVLCGRGTVLGSVDNTGGAVAPGPAGATGATGTLTVTGNYRQGPAGRLEIDVGPGGSDRLSAGSAFLDGSLTFTTPAGFDPPVGAAFDIVDGESRVGTFQSVTSVGAMAGGKRLAPSYFAGGVRAVVVTANAPAAPDLEAASDSGVSSADDITRDNTPTLSGPADDGTTVSVFADGVPIGSAVASGGRYSVQVAPGDALADGIHVLTARVVDAQGNPGPASAPLGVEIDTAPPQVFSAAFLFAASPHQIVMTFDKDVVPNLGKEDLAVERPGLDQPPFHPDAVSYDDATSTATFSFNGQLGNGNYRAALSAGALGDTAGNPLSQDYLLDFFVLIGDVNRDRMVNGTDFALLAGNFGRTGTAYGQGDLNADGAVDGTDFALLAGNFGRTVPLPPAGASPDIHRQTAARSEGRLRSPRRGMIAGTGTELQRRVLRVLPHTRRRPDGRPVQG